SMDHTESRPQRRGDQAGARRGSDQREPPQIQAVRSGARPLTDDDVELEVLHRRIEDLFDVGLEAVDFVDEQYVAEFEVRENRCEIAFELDQWPGGRAEARTHFVRDY